MNRPKGKFLYHALAFMTMALWGVTFVATKTLINEGLTPGITWGMPLPQRTKQAGFLRLFQA